MSRPRLSIAVSMSLIALLALVLAALARPCRLGAVLAFSLTATTLTLATVSALTRPGDARRFWVGFSLAGWIYLWMAFGTYAEGAPNDRRSLLLPTFLLDAAYPWVNPQGIPQAVAPLPNAPRALPRMSLAMPIPLFQQDLRERWTKTDWTPSFGEGLPGSVPYYHIGHSLFALISALAVGGLANAFVPKSRSE